MSAGDVARDAAVYFGGFALVEGGQRAGVFDDGGRFGDVQKRVAARARHLRVDLHDEAASRLRRGEGDVDAGAEAHPPVTVGRGALDEGRIERQCAVGEEGLDFVEKYGDRVGSPGLHRGTRIGGDEERVVPEALRELGIAIGGWAEVDAVQQFDCAQAGGMGAEALDQGLRRRGTHVNEDALAAFDHRQGFERGAETFPVGGYAVAHRQIPSYWSSTAGVI